MSVLARPQHLPCLPEAVEHLPVRLDTQHDIVGGGVMDEGALGVHEEHVRDPNLLYQPAIKCHAQVVGAWKRQPLVLPVMPQVESHGEVLGRGHRKPQRSAGHFLPRQGHHVSGSETEPSQALLLNPGFGTRERGH